MFFVLSGFLITRILIRGNEDGVLVGQFYRRRFFRIYPVYAMMILISLVLYFSLNPAQFLDAAATLGRYLFFFQNYYLRNPFLEHTWSLVVTEQFYLFFPLVVAAVYSLIKSSAARRMFLVAGCLTVLVMAPWIRIYYLKHGHALLEWPFRSPFPFLTTLYHLGPIVFGCLLALLEPFWRRWGKSPAWGWFFWSIGVSLFVYLSLNKYWDYFVGEWYLYTLGYLSVGCLMIAAFNGVSFFSRIKEIQWLGRHSYGIYIWHYLALYYWATWLGKIPPLLVILAFLASGILLGVISTHTVERYFLRLREKFVPRETVSGGSRTLPTKVKFLDTGG